MRFARGTAQPIRAPYVVGPRAERAYARFGVCPVRGGGGAPAGGEPLRPSRASYNTPPHACRDVERQRDPLVRGEGALPLARLERSARRRARGGAREGGPAPAFVARDGGLARARRRGTARRLQRRGALLAHEARRGQDVARAVAVRPRGAAPGRALRAAVDRQRLLPQRQRSEPRPLARALQARVLPRAVRPRLAAPRRRTARAADGVLQLRAPGDRPRAAEAERRHERVHAEGARGARPLDPRGVGRHVPALRAGRRALHVVVAADGRAVEERGVADRLRAVLGGRRAVPSRRVHAARDPRQRPLPRRRRARPRRHRVTRGRRGIESRANLGFTTRSRASSVRSTDVARAAVESPIAVRPPSGGEAPARPAPPPAPLPVPPIVVQRAAADVPDAYRFGPLIALGVVALCTAVGWISRPWFTPGETSLVYVLGLLWTASRLPRRDALLGAVASVAAFDF